MTLQDTSREIEFKFILTEGCSVDALKQTLENLSAKVSSATNFSIYDRYFDTDDWWLHRAGVSLRIREIDRKVFMTLKSLTPITNGVASRLELEEPLPVSSIQSIELPQPELLPDWLHDFCGYKSFRLLFDVETQRSVLDLNISKSTCIKACVDKTRIHSKEGEVKKIEIEFELQRGNIDEARIFADNVADRLGLTSNQKSKFKHGLSVSGLIPPKMRKPSKYTFKPNERTVDAAFHVLRRNFDAFCWNEPGTRLGFDPEYLHDMRVAIRRLRAALEVFSDALPKKRVRWLEKELKWIARTLGQVRDLDVHIQNLDAERSQLKEADSKHLEAFRRWLMRKREQARESLLQMFNSERYGIFTQRFERYLNRGPSTVSKKSLASKPIKRIAPAWLDKRLKKVKNRGDAIHEDSLAEHLHKLRIHCKKLRYLGEILHPLYNKPIKKFTKRVTNLQDVLGEYQDAGVAQKTLDRFLATKDERIHHSIPAAVHQILSKHYDRTAMDSKKRFFETWKEFSEKKHSFKK